VAGGKWIPDLMATTPVADAARQVLTLRLQVVSDYLPLAIREADNDVEHVHQLRVATRRARAALDIFASCLPVKVYRTARKELRTIRRAAGEARDWDVFIANLAQWSREQSGRKPAVDSLLGYAVARRDAAQHQLAELSKQYPFAFVRFQAQTVAAVHKSADSNLRVLLDLARPMLTGLLNTLDAAARLDLDDYEQLHQVRILGKRLRYAMEVFADCFSPKFREQLYPQVEEMQEILGSANDSYLASGRLKAFAERLRTLVPLDWQRYRPGIEAILRYQQQHLLEQRQQFLNWWERWHQCGGEAAFFALLKSAENDSPVKVTTTPPDSPAPAELSATPQIG
jgi:CHAD domain-containing protein